MQAWYRPAAVLLLATLLAGCGAQTAVPLGTPVAALATQSLMTEANAEAAPLSSLGAPDPTAFPDGDAQANQLIAQFQAIQGSDDAAMAQREKLVGQLGDTDSDVAVTFLENEEANLANYPDTARDAYEQTLLDALDALDSYSQPDDDPAIQAGPGSSDVTAMAYRQAKARKRRHKGMLYWSLHPVKAVGHMFKGFWQGLVGKPKSHRTRRPSNGGGGYGNGGNGNGGYPGGSGNGGGGNYGPPSYGPNNSYSRRTR